MLSLLTPAAKPAVPKKPTAVTAIAAKKTDAATPDATGVDDISEAPLAVKKVVIEEKLTGVKTRSARAAAEE